MKPPNSPTAENQFAKAFAIAREALKHVGTFKTPPTPQVYELWYRYVEGTNTALNRELDAAVEASDLNELRIADLFQRHFPGVADVELHQRAGELLANEVQHLQATLHKQFDAGRELQSVLANASEELTAEDLPAESLTECITAVLLSNEAMQQRVAKTNLRLQASEQKIHKLQQELLLSQKAMLTDALTQIGNRRLFDSTIDSIIENASGEYSQPGLTAMILIDLDEFKRVNDRFGHGAGDDLLVYVASELQRRCDDGSAARVGGDEFAILKTFIFADQAEELGEAIREHFSSQSLLLNRTGQELGKVTLSIGIAILRSEDTSASWYNRADQLLYVSKNCGGNRVTIEAKTGR